MAVLTLPAERTAILSFSGRGHHAGVCFRVDIIKRTRELQLKTKQFATKGELLANSTANLRRLFRGGCVAGLIAFLFTAQGFLLWYYRLQRYQDRVVRKEAEERAPRKPRRKDEAGGNV